MKAKVAGILVVVLSVAAAGLWGYQRWQAPAGKLTATGTVEVTRVDIVSKVGGYMADLRIQAGDTIAAGQLIARIDRPDLTAQLAAGSAAIAKGEAQLKNLEAGARREELAQTAARVNVADSNWQKARQDLRRYQELYQSAAISAQQYEAAQTAAKVAEQTLADVQAQYELLLAGNREEVITAQREEVRRLTAEQAVTQTTLQDSRIYSPQAGVIISKNFENGEYIAPGAALATLADLTDCWVKVYIGSEDLACLSLQQPVSIKVDGYPQRTFDGVVKEISQQAEFTPRQSISSKERSNLVFAVKVKISNPEGIIKPGMPADVSFL